MKIYTRNGKRFNIHANLAGTGIDPNNLDASGIVEVEIADPPADDMGFYTTQEYDEAPFIEYIRKPDDVIRQIKNDRIDNQIDSLERNFLIPRAIREFMLLMMSAQFPQDALVANPGYVKLKAFDEQIKSLRSQKQ